MALTVALCTSDTAADMDSLRRHRHWSVRIGLVIVLVAASGGCLVFYSSTLEDAYITFRYAVHAAEGHGLGAWNIGDPPVEGYTTTLWMLALSLGDRLGLSPLTFAKLLGWFFLLGLLAFVYRADRFIRPALTEWDWRTGGILSAIWLVGYLPVAWYAASGMESPLYMFLLTVTLLLAVRNVSGGWSDVIAAGLLILTRPEGILPAMVILLGAAGHRFGQGVPLRQALLKPTVLAVVQIAVIAFRFAYYGHMFPNSYYAKVAGGGWSHIHLGLGYLQGALKGWRYWLPLLPYLAAVVFFVRQRRKNLLLLAWLAIVPLVAIFIAKTGGDNPSAFPYARHLLHILPIVLLPGLAALASQGRVGRNIAIGVTIAGVLVMDLAVLQKIGPVKTEYAIWREDDRSFRALLAHERPKELVRWVRDVFPASTRMAVALGGELPYFTNFHTVDMLGLSNEYIAQHGQFQGDAVDSKTDMGYVLSLRPDLIESTISATTVLEGHHRRRNRPWRGMMEDEMVDNGIFRREYLFVRNAPYESWPRALFVRRDFWESLPNREEVEVIATSQTSLYQPISAI